MFVLEKFHAINFKEPKAQWPSWTRAIDKGVNDASCSTWNYVVWKHFTSNMKGHRQLIAHGRVPTALNILVTYALKTFCWGMLKAQDISQRWCWKFWAVTPSTPEEFLFVVLCNDVIREHSSPLRTEYTKISISLSKTLRDYVLGNEGGADHLFFFC